ncbi:MAG: helix-turn-helix domain-containing protein [Waddliaceae bacterium]|jgi:cytoskeletal protein RodZ|nr:helix-turn-helix domain-containing protein [Waddliaceae bacterium]MBT3578982.1 helix-turn-helix domain-containing protein [Waddliaceae bacterium]MBT4444668.1 helix-turn-helix domain-containing protein [Waddliaceae bacterium]MBT6929179.1 helix-turn-helix domain-containing protein [Waddliaceae bacterium]MBT7265153.1 helix-turn-helix domain-containing protein [Waddliaceae bacterium]
MPANPANMGDIFKRKRNEMSLSLKEVENATSIRTNYLQAIEKGSIANIISHVYAKGFIQQYAIFLGLDGDSILREYKDIFGEDKKVSPKPMEFVHDTNDNVKRLPNAVMVGGSILVLIAAWYLAKYLGVL